MRPRCGANHAGHRTGAHTTRVNHKGAHDTREAMQLRAMPTCTTRRDGVIGPRAHGSVGRQVVDDQENTQRGGATGPHAHGNAARHVVDDLNAEGSGLKPYNGPHNNQHNPQCPNYWAPLMRKQHQQEHRPQRPSERSDPTQHAEGRTGVCPGPCKETATRRNVTQGDKQYLWGTQILLGPILVLGLTEDGAALACFFGAPCRAGAGPAGGQGHPPPPPGRPANAQPLSP